MPKISGIRDWHCVTMGQIGSTERRPHLQVLLPLEEMRSRETKRITRQGGREGREERLQIGPVLLKEEQ